MATPRSAALDDDNDNDHDQDRTHFAAAAALDNLSPIQANLSLFTQPIQPPIAEPPSHEERRIVNHFRTLRSRIHDGPFYTILDSTARISKSGRRSPAAAHFNPFEGAQTYSQRFVKKKNTLPRLSTRPFVKDLFPRELHATIDPTTAPNAKKSLHLHTRTRDEKLWSAFKSAAGADEDDAEAGAQDDENVDEDEEGGNKDDEDREDEDPDQFDEEDEDEGDDYNAEQYFDGGDDDDMGADEGGGGDEDY